MAIYRLGEHRPQIHPSAYVHDSAVLIGAVTIGARSSVWPGAVLRADNAPIVVGEESNIQDNCVIHADPGLPVHIGNGATIGHQAMLHGCTVGDGSLIGIQAVVLNECVIGRRSLVGACALLTERRHVADGAMALGAPAKVLRSLTVQELDMLGEVAQSYVRRAALFQAELERLA
jgi:carbonic anhydrase/acetyltransferase-like protein (isoleucine patch superfamily)